MMSRAFLLSTTAALLGAIACSGSGSGSGTAADNPANVEVAKSSLARVPAANIPASALDAAVAANNAFAVDLYAHVDKQPGANVLTSPISASLALTMTYAGAAGETKTQMATTLHLDPAAGDAVFAGQNALSQALNGRAAAALANAKRAASGGQLPAASDYQLQVVNSVWGEKSITWAKQFLDTLATDYGTGVYQQDFVHDFDPARVVINDWVSANTNDKIKDLIPSGALDSLTRMVLVNAIHLKLPWADAFDKESTAPGDFTRSDGSTVSVDFMHRTGSFAYLDDGQAQIVSLPLANRELSVVIALPHADVTLAAYEAALTENSAALLTPEASQLVELSLPKASFTSDSVSLADALKAMGMVQAFEFSANLTGLCEQPSDCSTLYVSDVLQKAMIAMQETGVEAAAATAVIVRSDLAIALPVPAPVPMTVNRPYLVAIVDNPTGALLMLGQIADPSDAGSP